MARGGKRDLTEEEKRLWQQVAKTTRPLAASGKQKETAPVAAKKVPALRPRAHAVVKTDKATAKTLVRGVYHDMDRNTAERFRKGKYPIDATLDLHGMTSARAHAAFTAFVQAHYHKGRRCLLVITGKGLNKENRGVLREMLPRWLAEDSDLRPMVLAFDVAKPQHGGTGAYYILLKRKR